MKRVLLMAALAVLLVPAAAMADTIVSFAGSAGYTNQASLTFGPVVVYGWGPLTGNTNNAFFDPAVLYQRDEPNDAGLGVCSEGKTNCDTLGGNVNELDNMNGNELISLGFAPGGPSVAWVSVSISSMDVNAGNPIERGELYACDNVDPNLFTSCTLLAQFEGTTPVEQTFLIPTANQYDALFFVPVDWKNHTNYDNDFLVMAATVRVPEPATLSLLGLGLGSLALALKSRKK